MNIKEYLKTLLKYKEGKGLIQTANVVFSEEEKTDIKGDTKSTSSKKKAITAKLVKEENTLISQEELSNKQQATVDSLKYKEHIVKEDFFNEINSTLKITSKERNETWIPCFNKKELLELCKTDGKMITVGFDFGTHQTKICVESKGGMEISYTFMKFGNKGTQLNYTLPSIIGVQKNGKMQYGFLSQNFDGDIIRYFKQAVFKGTSPDGYMTQELSLYYSIWYIAYILFDLEEVFGQNFSIQFGVPSDSSHIMFAKRVATRIVASSYKLVEEVFRNNKSKFLDTDIETLKKLTEIVGYSDELKKEYELLVFPEAYSCLKPMINQKKIERGMSLMVDIGGGTTDISFFTIENGSPQVYDFFSINKGLNYLTCAESRKNIRLDSNIKYVSEIDNQRRYNYKKEIEGICNNIRNKLLKEFRLQTTLNKERLLQALKKRPIIYTGGGSTFSSLRVGYMDFVDVKQISEKEWEIKSVPQIDEIRQRKLFPILSTAYGLSISTEHDNIVIKPFNDIFKPLRGYKEEERKVATKQSYFGRALGGFDYADDWDALK